MGGSLVFVQTRLNKVESIHHVNVLAASCPRDGDPRYLSL